MATESILFERRDGVGWVTLNRPEAMNSLNPQLIREFDQALTAAEEDPEVRVLVVTGAGRGFCAGADLKYVGGEIANSFDESLLAFLREIGAVFDRLEALPLPTIAAVNGLALAGGLELVLCCDLVVAAESAKLGDAHANYGLLPGGGGSIRLPRKIGPTRAKALLYTGEFLPAEELRACGLVNQVVPLDRLFGAVEQLAASISRKSPLGLRHMKELVAVAEDCDLVEGLKQERAAFAEYAQSEDIREGLAAFKEKRSPHFAGR